MEWKSSIADIDEVTKQLTVSVPPEAFQSEFDAAIERLTKTAAVKGFRAGKAPRAVVERLHGPRVKSEVASRLISSSLWSSIEEHKLQPVAQPALDVKGIELGQQLEYTATIAIEPTPQIKDYDQFEITVPRAEITDSDLDRTLNRLREAKAGRKNLEFRRTAQNGDIIDGMLKIQLQGEVEVERPEPFAAVLGEGKLPKDVEEALVGMELGTTRVVQSTIPADYPSAELREHPAIYTFTLNLLAEKVLPEIDDEFAKSLGYGVETLLELRMKIRDELTAGRDKSARQDAEAAILRQLLERNEFKVPQPMVDDELRSILVREGILDPAKINVRELSMEPFRQSLGEAAEKRVKIRIMVDRIAEQEQITVADEDLTRELERMAEKTGVPLEEVRKYFYQHDQGAGLRRELVGDKVLELLVQRAKINYVAQQAAEDAQPAA